MKPLVLGLIAGALAAWQEAPAAFRIGCLIHEASVKSLPAPVEKGPYSSCVFRNGKAWADFVKIACTERDLAAHPAVDWDKEAVIVVAYRYNSNRITFKDWKVTDAEKKQATLTLTFRGIEPYYRDHYPAVFHRIPTAELQSIRIVVESEHVADPKDKLLEIAVLSLTDVKAK